MDKLYRLFLPLNIIKIYKKGFRYLSDPIYNKCRSLHKVEKNKTPTRTEILNFILTQFNRKTAYLEIGVRNPNDNFSHIKSDQKYSVDPGVEFKENPVDFQMESDEFFKQLDDNKILNSIKFDVIFIDGLHLAEQVDRDIINALKYIKDDGFIVLHDCNPPTEWHARENYNYGFTPAGGYWHGTTWKAFLKWLFNPSLKSCCVNSDWGVGVLTKKHPIGNSMKPKNLFFEYKDFDQNRTQYLNLVDFKQFKSLF